jgi:hypothetical protein
MNKKRTTSPEKKPVALMRPRFTTYMRRDLAVKLKRAAVEKRLPLTDVVEEAVSQYLAREEKKLGRPFAPIAVLRAGRPIRSE